MGKYYTGVGSRNTPPAVMKQLKKLAIYHRSIIGSFLENYDVSVEYN